MHDFHGRPPAPPSSRPPFPRPEEEYSDGYWCVPPVLPGEGPRRHSSDDDGIIVVGTSSSLGGIALHKNRKIMASRRISRPGSHLDAYSPRMPLYDEVSAHTTISTLSPQSRRTEKSCMGRMKNMHYHQSLDGTHSNYEPFLKPNMVLSDSSGGSSSTQSNLRRMKDYLRNVQDKYYIYDKTGSIYYRHLNEANNLPILDQSRPHLLLSLPEQFRVGEIVSGDLPPGQMVYTHFSVQHDSPVQFNVSVSSRARIAIYARQTLKPTLTIHNYIETIRGDHLHIAGITRRQRRESESLESALKSALVQFHLLPGKWYLGFFNDGLYPEPITFVATTVKKESELSVPEASKTCKYDCFSKGVCRDGKCHCHAGFSGEFCEETACPVLCSGNGIYSNGKCSCHEGFKGPDCDLDGSWCTVPDCNNHGICASDGNCHCDHGWSGEFCDQKDCADPTCSNNGICQNGTCYCAAGWYGSNCEQRISTACSPLDHYNLPRKSYQSSSVGKIQNDVPVADKEHVPVRKIEKLPKRNEESTCSPACVHGVCLDGHCVCDISFGGEDCSEKICLPGCEKHGTCNNGICECEQGWNGENCFIEGCPGNCSGIGTCQQFKGLWQCACDNNHYGKNCELARETNCGDGIDNDEDGLVDCEDFECCSNKMCSENLLCTSAIQPRDVLLRIPSLAADANFFQKNKFLIESDSVQRYADVKQFNESRVSVIHGHVVSSKGGPLTGVRISDVSSNRLGFSLSRSEDGGGTFDIMVNGGGYITLQFLRQPFGKVERSFYVPANAIVNVGEVVMNEVPEGISSEATVPEECKTYHLNHQDAYQMVPSWLLNQYAGGIKSGNDFDAEFTRIVADARIVHESVPIEDTDFELVYNSDRADGFQSSIYMALLPSEFSNKLRLVHVQVQIAGRSFEEKLAARPNLTFTFNWNHLNVYEQAIHGLHTAAVSLGFEYEGCSKKNEIVWRHEQIKLEGKKSRKSAFGLWSFNFQHYYDFLNNVLERGDGLTNYFSELPPVMRTLLGHGTQREASCGDECHHQSLQDTKLFQPNTLAVANDGTLYIGDHNLIRRVNSARTSVTTVLELNPSDIVHSYYLAIDPFTQDLYISIPLKRQIWMLKSHKKIPDLSKNFKVVVGDGSICTDADGACGDRGLAESAKLNFPKDITFDNHGNLYVLDGRRIRYVTKDKQINTLHSSPDWKPYEDCSPVFPISELNLEWPMSILFEPFSSELIVLDTDIVYKLSFHTGVARILAGIKKGCSPSSHGTPVIENAQAIALSPENGRLYIAESDSKRTNLIRSMSVNGGQLKIIAGRASKCDCDRVNCPCDQETGSESVVATQSLLHKPMALAVDFRGEIYIADQANFKIKTIERTKAVYDQKTRSYKINSPGSNEVYYFNKHGMHQKTVNLLSGQEVHTFKYSVDTSFGDLSEVIDESGFSLRITRVNETDLILEGSQAKKTLIRQNSFDKELLEAIQTLISGGRKIQLEYGTGQLLKSLKVNDKTYFLDYDDSGRVALLSKSSGEVYSFSWEYQLGRYLSTDVALNGHRIKRFVSRGNNVEVTTNEDIESLSRNENSVLYSSEGSLTQYDIVSHPLLEPQETALLKQKITLPSVDKNSELSSRFEWRSYVRAGDGRDILQINGRNVFTIKFDRVSLTDTFQDGFDNDILKVSYNRGGKIIEIEVFNEIGLSPLNITYDSKGLLTTVTWGNLRHDLAYDGLQRLVASTYSKNGDLLVRKFTYGHEGSFQPSMVQIPSGKRFKWKYGKDGGILSLKSPGDDVSEFWSSLGLTQDFAAFYHRKTKIGTVEKVTTVIFNSKGQLTSFLPPDDSRHFNIERNEHGKVKVIRNGKIKTIFDYEKNRFNVTRENILRQYVNQGPLLVNMVEMDKKELFNAEISYDKLFRVQSIKADFNQNSWVPVFLTYDTITSRITNISHINIIYMNMIRNISSEKFTMTSKYSSTHQIEHQQIIVNDNVVLEAKLNYDSVGRIKKNQWTINRNYSFVETWDYSIDGQLSEYSLVGRENHQWIINYDEGGRIQKINEQQIKLITGGAVEKVGKISYIVDENGWTIRRGDEEFEYDSLGQLTRVSKGKYFVEYIYDEKHRISSRKNNNEIQKFYYLWPGNENLISHFMDGGKLWNIYYIDETPVLMESSEGDQLLLATDPSGSLRFVFSTKGDFYKEFNYSPTGSLLKNENNIFIPIGYNGRFHDFSANIAFVRESFNGVSVTRPLDLTIGRFMSTSLNTISQVFNTFDPQIIADPFCYEHQTHAQSIPIDPIDWISMTGFSDIVSGAIVSMNQQLGLFNQVMTMGKEKPSKFRMQEIHRKDESLGSLGIGLHKDRFKKASVERVVVGDLLQSSQKRLWLRERNVAKKFLRTSYDWDEKQRHELLDTGIVRAATVIPPGDVNPIEIQDIDSWKFKV
ncbi:hypothetical protein FO519_004387 [Halicephalobus sp. NKZ332]|nr:hypothetical protein FO519_004387 [Halicephalobus sp. NKZ332]